MMNKSTQTLLAELRKKQVSVSTVASYLEMDDNVRMYGLESFISLLNEYNEEFLSEDLVNHLIGVIEKSLEEKRLEEENEMNKLILDSSYSHYQEVLTLLPNLDGKLSYVSEYKGKESADGLEYYVFAPKLGVSNLNFTINNLNFTVTPVEPISYKSKSGEMKQVSYKYSVRIIHTLQRTSVGNDFEQFKVDALYFVLGMSYLPGSNMVKTEIEPDVITLNIDTYPFYSELARKYNSYYSNITTSGGISLSEISGIEKCHFDLSGAILVPKLFYYSSMILDCDISSRPFVWDNNQGFDMVPLKQNSYRITMNFSKSVSETEANTAASKFIDFFESQGVQLKSSGVSFGNGNVNNVNFQIVNYDTFGPDFTSTISRNLLAERKVSEIFKTGILRGMFSYPDYHAKSNSITPDTEKYSFILDGDSLRSSYIKTDNKYMIFFNRSSYSVKNSAVNDGSDLVKIVNDTNTQKFMVNGQMLAHYSSSNMTYGGKTYQDTYSNYIPTSIIPVSYKKTEGRDANRKTVDCTGVSFLPFGFAKYTTTDSNRALCLTGYAVYGSSFDFEPATVYRVLKLSNDPSEIQNIVQIVIQSEIEPQFDEKMDLPIRVQRLNSSYYTALFRSSGYQFRILTPGNWFFANEYSLDSTEHDGDVSFTRKVFIDVRSNSKPQVHQSSLLRYYLETLVLTDDFKKAVIANWKPIFSNGNQIALSEFFKKFSDSVEIQGVPSQFFTFVANSCEKGVPNDNIFDIIREMTMKFMPLGESHGTFDKTFEMVKFFVNSVSKPVSSVAFPTYTSDIHSSIMLKIRTELNDVHNKVLIMVPELANRTIADLKVFSTKYSGFLRTAISMIAEIYEETPRKSPLISSEDLVEIEKIVYKRLVDETESQIFDNLVNSEITPAFVETLASEVSSEIFLRLIDQIQKMISNDETESQIRQILSNYILDMNVVSISQVSNTMFSLSYDSQYEEAVQVLNGYYISNSDRTLYLSDTDSEKMKFGNTKYDPNVHCMISVTHPGLDSSSAIMLAFSSGNVCYARIGDKKMIDNLSIVSIYKTDDDHTKFFLPFTYNNGKLTVNSVKFIVGECTFALESDVCEIEVTANKAFTQEKLKLLSRLAICSKVLNATRDYTFLKSLVLSGLPIEKPYVVDRKMYHYVFTSDIKEEFVNGKYLVQEMSSHTDDDISDASSLEVYMYPAPLILSKYQMKKSVFATDISTFFGKRYAKGLGMKLSEFTPEHQKVVDNNLSYFTPKYSKSERSSDEVLVVSTSNRIYTKYYGNRLLESTISSSPTEYQNYISEINFEKSDEISSIDKIVLDEAIESMNKVRSKNNSIHNLSLAMSSLKWDEVHIDNYHFYSDEKPKWVRFSEDASYMGVGFRSGVKIYIKVGTRYLFCTNLHHEDVSNIYFGNKEFCITTQYEDTEREFAILWVTTAGVPIKLKIPFYTPVEGDAVNVKYISGNTTKDKKNVILEMDGDKMKYGAFTVQYAEPIFNHNVYFFSKNDRYLVYNRSGSFRVYDLQNMKYVTFNTLNGETISSATVLPKPIETGSWVSDHTFVGFTYMQKNPLLKMKVTLDLTNLSVHINSALSEFPSSTLYEKMTTEKSVNTHMLYSYLMNKKAEYEKNLPYIVGSWVYDCFISIGKIGENKENKEDKENRDSEENRDNKENRDNRHTLRIQSYDGYYSEILLDIIDESYGHEDIVNLFNNMVSMLNFQVSENDSGKVISTVKQYGQLIYSRELSYEKREMQKINDTFYSFIGSSVFVWEYGRSSTQVTHINPRGYERMIFRGHLIVFTSDTIRVGFVDNSYLSLNHLHITDYFDSSKRAVNVASVLKRVEDVYETEVIAYTETSVEKYNSTSENAIPIIVDSKPISSALCLNRYADYVLRSHVSTSAEISHGNLLIIVNGRHVKIIPKTVQVPKVVDGYTMSWYAKHESQDWQTYEDEYNSYIAVTEQLLPCLAANTSNKTDYEYLASVFRNRDSRNFQMGVDQLRADKMPEDLINAVVKTFEIFQDVVLIYSKNLLIEKFRQYEKDEVSTDNGIKRYLGNKSGESFNQAYDSLIDILEPLIGNAVMKSVGIQAFNMIRDLQYNVVNGRKIGRTVDEVRRIINSQPSTNDRIRDVKQIINHILSIPLPNILIPTISKPDLFRSKYSNVKDEIKKMREMKSSKSKYELYRAIEFDRLTEQHMNYTCRYFALTSKINTLNEHPDFVYAMMYEPKRVPIPSGMTFENGFAQDQTHVYQVYERDGEVRCIQFLAKSVEVMSMRDVHEALLKPISTIVQEYFGPKFMLRDVAKICGCVELKKDETDYVTEITAFKNLATKQAERLNISANDVKSFIVDFGSLCKFLDSNGISYLSTDELKTIVNNVNSIRFPYDDVSKSQEIIASYNVNLPEESDPDLLQWNLGYVKEEYKRLHKFARRRYSVNSGTYDETYEAIRERLAPLLSLYRNGVCEETDIPVTSINLVFPREVKFVKKSDLVQSELSDIEFEYKIPEDRVSYDIEYGKVSLSLLDIIMKFEARNSKLNDDLKGLSVRRMIDRLKNHDKTYENGDGIKVLQKVIPQFPGCREITDFDELKTAYDSVFSPVVYRKTGKVLNPVVEHYKKNRMSQPQIAVVEVDVDYKAEYETSGIELNGVDYPLLYGNRINKEISGSLSSVKNISLGCVKSIDFSTQLVTRNGTPSIFKTDKSEYILYFGNTVKDSQSIGYLITQDVQTRETQVYHYIKKDKKGDEIMTYITDLNVDENDVFEMRESVYDSKFEKGKGFHEVIVENVTKFVGLQSLINAMKPVDPLNSKKYEESIIENTIVKSFDDLYATSVTYRSGAHYGSIVEVFDRSEKGVYQRIKSWNFHMFNVQAFDLTSTDIYLLGTTNGVDSSSHVKLGSMSIYSGKSDGSKPVFVKVFDRDISLSNFNVQGFNSPNVVAGKTTYVTFCSKNLSHLIVVNKKNSYESFNVNMLNSVHVSRESGFAALYYRDLNVTEIWNSNGKLVETIEGQCSWM